jgi:hypothetical protein
MPRKKPSTPGATISVPTNIKREKEWWEKPVGITALGVLMAVLGSLIFWVIIRPFEKASPSSTINAPNGIGIAGGTVIQPTVNNNFAPVARRISRDQHTTVVASLSKTPGKVLIWAVNTDNDALLFADDLYRVLKEAGWRMQGAGPEATLPVNSMNVDVAVFVRSAREQRQEAVVNLVDCLKSLNVRVDIGTPKECRRASSSSWLVLGKKWPQQGHDI